jgi:dienelactone hydrolase
MSLIRRSLLLGMAVTLCSLAHAAQQTIAFKAQGTQFENVLVTPAAGVEQARGALLLVPNWMGINAPNLKQAQLIADMGYVVFVADLYGKGVRPSNAQEAGAAAGKVKGDRTLMRTRMQRAMQELHTQTAKIAPKLAKSNVAALGFCFGGTAALELARSGAPIKAAISFHGGLDSPLKYDSKAVQARVLALHGADDPYVPPAEVQAFEQEMRTGGIDWELVSYGGAVHSFTDVDAKAKGQADYNAKVAKRAYERMQAMLNEAFAAP